MTILVAIWSMFILPDFPENSTWLTPEERALALLRIDEDSGQPNAATAHSLSVQTSFEVKEFLGRWPGLRLAVTDGKVWFLALALTSMVISLSFHAYFPTLTATLGYGPTVTLLLCAPPWLVGTALALAISRKALIPLRMSEYWLNSF